MRIWSIHPKYLDKAGVVALWRETLLAKHVLEGKTKGYKNHPQLLRFKAAEKPSDCINYYLSIVYEEALNRKYKFEKSKINWNFKKFKITVTKGQTQYEANHLLKKLQLRDPVKFEKLKNLKEFEVHPIFDIIDGEIESWEKLGYNF